MSVEHMSNEDLLRALQNMFEIMQQNGITVFPPPDNINPADCGGLPVVLKDGEDPRC